MREPFWVELADTAQTLFVLSQFTVERMRTVADADAGAGVCAASPCFSYVLREASPRKRPMRVVVDARGNVVCVVFAFRKLHVSSVSFRQWETAPHEAQTPASATGGGAAQTETLVGQHGPLHDDAEVMLDSSDV